MSFVTDIIDDLRDKRLLAFAAAALAAALVAVPLLLSKSSKSTPVAQAPATAQAPVPAGEPVVSSGSANANSKLPGRGRDPFTQLVHGSVGTIGATTTGVVGGASTPVTGAPTSGGTGSSSTSTSTSTATTGAPAAPTATIPTGTPTPAPAGLTATQSYAVKLAITNSTGGLDTIDPLERLSVLPNNRRAMLVELGVLKGGGRVLFAVQPGAVVSGPGHCIPAPFDCEVLSLGQDQTEALGTQTSRGTSPVALFAVTGITAAGHSSVAAASKARQAVSAAGHSLLSGSTSSALSLFRYEPSLGAIVDLRNLTVGG
jgi:hypothetical protein